MIDTLGLQYIYALRHHVHKTLVNSKVFPKINLVGLPDAPSGTHIPIKDTQHVLRIIVRPVAKYNNAANRIRIAFEAELGGPEFKIRLYLNPSWDKSRKAWVYDIQKLILKTQVALKSVTEECDRRLRIYQRRKNFLEQVQHTFAGFECKLFYNEKVSARIYTKYLTMDVTEVLGGVHIFIDPKQHISETVTGVNVANEIMREADKLLGAVQALSKKQPKQE